jgi:hypothetical protein
MPPIIPMLYGAIAASVLWFIGIQIKKKFWPNIEDNLRSQLKELQQKYDGLTNRFHNLRDK